MLHTAMYDHVAQICVDPTLASRQATVCSVPGRTLEDGVAVLEIVGSGGALGTGLKMSRLGVDIPRFRQAYYDRLTPFLAEAQAKLDAKVPPREFSRWAVETRTQIARSVRSQQGVASTVILEVRDAYRYGWGGRTYRNMTNHYVTRGFSAAALHQKLVQGAMSPNVGVSEAAFKGARFLRHGGRVLVPISIATTGYVLLTTPADQLGRVVFEEAGSFALGSAGTGVAVAVCLVFGIATGGWGLLACGVIGGLAGGLAGQHFGEKLYYTINPEVEIMAEETGVIPLEVLGEAGSWPQ